MNRLGLRIKLLLIAVMAAAILVLPSSSGKAACNGQCSKVNGQQACIRAFNSSGDPIDVGTDCAFLGGNCLTTQCA